MLSLYLVPPGYPHDLHPDIRMTLLVRGALAIFALASPARDGFSSYSQGFEERCNYREYLEPSVISSSGVFCTLGSATVTFSTVGFDGELHDCQTTDARGASREGFFPPFHRK